MTNLYDVKQEHEITVQDLAEFEWVRLRERDGENPVFMAIRKTTSPPLTDRERLAIVLELEG